MIPGQRGVLSELVRSVLSGRVSRRVFLQQAAGLCVTSAGLFSILESCSSDQQAAHTIGSSQAIFLDWESEHDDIGTYDALVNAYNRLNTDGIHVTYHNSPGGGQQHDRLVERVRKRQPNPEIFSMDIIWTDEFGYNNWSTPLNDYWSPAEQSLYLALPIQASIYRGKLWAAPFRTDLGLLYYRNDSGYVSLPPVTWTDLETIVHQVQSLSVPAKPQYGYLWQGKQFEGLVCVFVEMLSSYGGTILDPGDPERVVVQSPEAHAALSKMRTWLGKEHISPALVTNLDEGDTFASWEKGQAVFMRDWTTFIASSNDAGRSTVAANFGVTTIPGSVSGMVGRSCIGGWGLGINPFASAEKRDAAWKFIHWMLQEDAQLFAAVDASFTVTHSSVYRGRNLEYIEQQNPLYGKLYDMISNHAQLRPQTPAYQEFSQTIQAQVYQILKDPVLDIDASLAVLQKTLQAIMSRHA